MSDSFIQVPPDSTGKKLDTEQLTVGANTVERERMQIAGDSATDIAPVTAADGLTVNLGTNNDVSVTGTVTVDGSGVTQPVSAASLPLPTGAATAANQLPDGHNVTVDNAAGAAAVNIQDGGNSITVDGTVAVTNAGLTELAAAIDTELQVDVVGALPTGDNNIGNVDVASSALPTGAATSALQLPDGHNVTVDNAAGAAAVNIQDGGNSITVDGSVTVSATNLDVRDIDAATDDITVHGDVGVLDQMDLTNANPLTVAIVDATGDQIASFGGGTQYTEGDTDATIVGTAMLWEDAADELATVSSATPLPVNVVAGGAGDGAILDGVSSSIKATVLDLTNSNPLAVSVRDSNGDLASLGGGTQYTEDDAAAANPVGTALIMVRDDALSGQTTADGDNIASRGTDKGELYVKHVDAIPVTDNGGTLTVDGTVAVSGTVTVDGSAVTQPVSGTVTVQDGGGAITVDGTVAVTGVSTLAEQQTQTTHLAAIETATELLDDAAVVLGTATYTEATSTGLAVGAVRRDADTTLVNTTNEWGPLQMDANGRLKVEVFSGETLPVSGTVSVTEPVSVDDNGASLTVDNAALSVVGGGAEATALRVTLANDSTGVVSIDDNGGAITVDGTVTVTATDLDIRNLAPATDQVEVVGDVAADVAAAGNPVQIGAVQETMADSAPSTRVSADADIGYVAASDGAQYVIPTGPQTWSYHENSSSALTDTSVHAAPGAGLSLYVTDIIVSTGAATAFNIFFEEGASTVLGPYYLEAVAGRGFQVHFQTPKKITANTALTVTTSAAIAHGIDVTGFIARG